MGPAWGCTMSSRPAYLNLKKKKVSLVISRENISHYTVHVNYHFGAMLSSTSCLSSNNKQGHHNVSLGEKKVRIDNLQTPPSHSDIVVFRAVGNSLKLQTWKRSA